MVRLYFKSYIMTVNLFQQFYDLDRLFPFFFLEAFKKSWKLQTQSYFERGQSQFNQTWTKTIKMNLLRFPLQRVPRRESCSKLVSLEWAFLGGQKVYFKNWSQRHKWRKSVTNVIKLFTSIILQMFENKLEWLSLESRSNLIECLWAKWNFF